MADRILFAEWAGSDVAPRPFGDVAPCPACGAEFGACTVHIDLPDEITKD